MGWIDDLKYSAIALVGAIVNPSRKILNFSSAFTVDDNPTTGMTDVGLASGIGDWQSYTPGFNGVDSAPNLADGVIHGQWRRNGSNTIEVAILFVHGTTTTLSSGVAFGLPPGFTVDNTKLPGGVLTIWSVALSDFSTPANNKSGVVVPTSSGDGLQVNPFGTTSYLTSSVPWAWASGDGVLIGATLPVTED